MKPSTPLPWECPGLDAYEYVICASPKGKRRTIAHVYRHTDLGIKREENAAYIVAACNAYPELVAALRRSNAALKALHDLAAKRPMMETHLVTEAQTCGGAIVEAIDLLAKLGEGA